MTSSPIAFLTTRFGYRQYDVFDWAKKLTILESGMEIISYLIALFYLHYNFTWLGLVLEVNSWPFCVWNIMASMRKSLPSSFSVVL